MKGSFIVASAIFSGMVIVMVGINTLLLNTPFTSVEGMLVLGSLIVLIFTKPAIDEYTSLETEKEK